MTTVSVCGRTCHATFMNLSPAKQAQTKAMLAERNANQYRADNPNWKAGISEGMGHPLEPLPADDPRAAKDPEAREVYRERGRRKAKKARDAERRRKLRALGFKLPDDRRGRSGQ